MRETIDLFCMRAREKIKCACTADYRTISVNRLTFIHHVLTNTAERVRSVLNAAKRERSLNALASMIMQYVK